MYGGSKIILISYCDMDRQKSYKIIQNRTMNHTKNVSIRLSVQFNFVCIFVICWQLFVNNKGVKYDFWHTKWLMSMRSEYLHFCYLIFVAIVKGLSRFHMPWLDSRLKTQDWRDCFVNSLRLLDSLDFTARVVSCQDCCTSLVLVVFPGDGI
jgi:hypothetical protein